MDCLEGKNAEQDLSLQSSPTADPPVEHSVEHPVEPPVLQERKDFTSEIFKIEIKNLANFGFGVRIYFQVTNI